MLRVNTKMNTKRSDFDASDAPGASYKPINSGISEWCVSPFTPATGVQIPLGTPPANMAA